MSFDLEKNKSEASVTQSSVELTNNMASNKHQAPQGRWATFVDSFSRVDINNLDPSLTEEQKREILNGQDPEKSMKGRHLKMIAVGGCIGTGLFVGTGKALRTGGPASLLIGWLVLGSMIYCTVQSLGEMAVTYPVAGGYTTYYARFVDESFGFALNMNYLLQWLIVLPLEIVATAITIEYWGTSKKYIDGYVALFYVLTLIITFFGSKGYGETEFFCSLAKILAVAGFIILGIVIICGGAPNKEFIGAKYWHEPGPFNHGFKGVCSVFVTAAFSYSGTELVGLSAAESPNPRKEIPSACKQTFWRVMGFYFTCLLIIGFIIPYNDDRLLGDGSSANSASPFVLAIVIGGVKGLPSVMNVVILIAVFSVGNAAVFASNKTITSLAIQGYLPNIFGYIDKKGRPLVAIFTTFFVGLISFVAASPKQGVVFNWLIAISGMSALFTWLGICASHIRFRQALRVQGGSTEELAFTAQTGVWGSWWSILIIMLVFIAQFWVSLWPLGGGLATASYFFQQYISVPIVLVSYVLHKLWSRNWSLLIKVEDIDIDTGRAVVDVEMMKQEAAEDKAILSTKPFYVKVYRFLC